MTDAAGPTRRASRNNSRTRDLGASSQHVDPLSEDPEDAPGGVRAPATPPQAEPDGSGVDIHVEPLRSEQSRPTSALQRARELQMRRRNERLRTEGMVVATHDVARAKAMLTQPVPGGDPAPPAPAEPTRDVQSDIGGGGGDSSGAGTPVAPPTVQPWGTPAEPSPRQRVVVESIPSSADAHQMPVPHPPAASISTPPSAAATSAPPRPAAPTTGTAEHAAVSAAAAAAAHDDDDDDEDAEDDDQSHDKAGAGQAPPTAAAKDGGEDVPPGGDPAAQGAGDVHDRVRPASAALKPSAGPPYVDTSDRRVFLMAPAPKGPMLQGSVERTKGGMGTYPKYVFSLRQPTGEAVVLLAARKRGQSKTSNYLVSMDANDLSPESGNVFGKVRSNMLGTEFKVYDRGLNPNRMDRAGPLDQPRAELGVVLYKQNVIYTRGPRRMTVVLPSPASKPPRPSKTSDDSELLARCAATPFPHHAAGHGAHRKPPLGPAPGTSTTASTPTYWSSKTRRPSGTRTAGRTCSTLTAA